MEQLPLRASTVSTRAMKKNTHELNKGQEDPTVLNSNKKTQGFCVHIKPNLFQLLHSYMFILKNKIHKMDVPYVLSCRKISFHVPAPFFPEPKRVFRLC